MESKNRYGILIQRIHVPRSMRGKTKFSDRRTHLCGLTKVFFYQIYPLGFCGAPFENDGSCPAAEQDGIQKVNGWIGHIKKLGANSIYFSPLFESDTHGYNTRDFKRWTAGWAPMRISKRSVRTFIKKESGWCWTVFSIMWEEASGPFRMFCRRGRIPPYLNWFHIDLGGNSNYNDGLWYEGWEGNYDLVKLNLQNEEVITHIFDCVRYWVEEFDIDGLRLDVAYCLDHNFVRRLRSLCDELKPDFSPCG